MKYQQPRAVFLLFLTASLVKVLLPRQMVRSIPSFSGRGTVRPLAAVEWLSRDLKPALAREAETSELSQFRLYLSSLNAPFRNIINTNYLCTIYHT